MFIPVRAGAKSASALHSIARVVKLTVSDSSDDTTNAELDTGLVPVNGSDLNNDSNAHDDWEAHAKGKLPCLSDSFKQTEQTH